MLISTLTQKGQATIPTEIRKLLDLHTGDKLEFEVKDNVIILKKLQPFDYEHHQMLSSTLSEWESKEDDDAYKDL